MDDFDTGNSGKSDPALFERLIRIVKVSRAYMQINMLKAGLHLGQDELLNALSTEEPITLSKVAAHISVRPSTISKMLDRLEKDGIVKRTRFSSDARLTGMILTEKGAEAQSSARLTWKQMEQDVFKGLSESEIQMIGRSLETLDIIIGGRLRRIR